MGLKVTQTQNAEILVEIPMEALIITYSESLRKGSSVIKRVKEPERNRWREGTHVEESEEKRREKGTSPNPVQFYSCYVIYSF